jgi:acyl-CoA synthetase (AMP-forming)/AMP-acid ligase II
VKVDTIQAGDFLRLSAQRFPDRDCFVFDDGSSRSFGETNRRVNQLAGEYVEVLMACMKLGVVYVPLNNRLADNEVLTLLRRAELRARLGPAGGKASP